ncbi:hypothetical protein D5F52_26595 (plasmid) [Brevibacillus laterosporus]|uniref:hypothetical protein n=1 Tax=Brevibacillus laterosporus TaxID=1465 RepID=UPI000E6C7C1A|nr:hypothetical protein [Brevibacillus laterosporus]AYB41726.1 hypothetical protein D5F52_26595 [Brevibacillus laterosporus]
MSVKKIFLLTIIFSLYSKMTLASTQLATDQVANSFDWELVKSIVIVLGAGAAYFFLKKGRKEMPKEKAIDWFKPKKIEEDGFIETEDGRFMVMLEVQPIPFILKSPREQTAIWSGFREWLSMIPHPVRFRVQSYPYSLQDYFYEAHQRALELGDLGNIQYNKELEEVFNNVILEQKIQDQRYYIILETDYRYLGDVGITNSPFLHDVMNKMKKHNQVDNYDVAKQELFNSVRLTKEVLFNIKINIRQMYRKDVLEYLYGAINREMSSLMSLEEFEQKVADDMRSVTSLSNI